MNPQSLMGRLTQGMAAGSSPMDQVTPGSPMFQPGMTPPQQAPMPNKSFHLQKAFQRRGMPMPPQVAQMDTQQPPQATPQSGQPPQPAVTQQPQVPLSEAELIIKAMAKHLDHKGKMEAKILEAALPQDQTPISSPQQ
jgi:hypothetical protein